MKLSYVLIDIYSIKFVGEKEIITFDILGPREVISFTFGAKNSHLTV